jgi:hypothetical protein
MMSRLIALAMSLVVVIAVSVTLVVTGVSASTPSKKMSETAQFVRLMKRGVSSAYVATYEVSNFDIFSAGSITVANIPPRPGTKVPTNVNDYSSNLESSYVYRDKDGRIVQWIQDETSISACVNEPTSSGYHDLLCSRPFQYIPSNGFGEEGVGFVPESVLQSFEQFNPTFLAKSSSIFFEPSRQFGKLQCIRQKQVKGSERETTCLNRNGLVVSWMSQNVGAASRVLLTNLSLHPTKKDFVTMKRPTKAMILPSF